MTTDARESLRARMLLITEGPLPRVMRKLVVPSAIWYLLNYGFFVVDTYYVGRLGTSQLAAMSLICAVLALTITLAQGVGSALAATVSAQLGAGKHAEASRLVTNTLALAVILAAALWVVGTPSVDVLFVALGATPEQLPFVREFMPIWYAGFGFVMLSTACQAAIRATGDVTTPVLILLGTGVLNALLDPVLMDGWGPVPAQGMRGVAMAGLLSRAAGTLIGLWIVARRDSLLRFEAFGSLRASWIAISRIAGPVILQMMAFALSTAALLRIAAEIGPEMVAGLGVGTRIDAIVSALVLGLPIVLPTFIGQNAGAGNLLRAGQGIVIGMRQVLVAQVAIAVALALSAHGIAAAFSDDPAVREAVALFLLVVPAGNVAYALLTTAAGSLIALGRMRGYMVTGIAPCIACVAFAWLGARFFGALGLIVAIPLVRIAGGIVSWIWVKAELRAAGYFPSAVEIASAQPT
jgi:putative MATE family efflux protein